MAPPKGSEPDVVQLRRELRRAQTTADGLSQGLDSARRRNAALKAENARLRQELEMSRSARAHGWAAQGWPAPIRRRRRGRQLG